VTETIQHAKKMKLKFDFETEKIKNLLRQLNTDVTVFNARMQELDEQDIEYEPEYDEIVRTAFRQEEVRIHKRLRRLGKRVVHFNETFSVPNGFGNYLLDTEGVMQACNELRVAGGSERDIEGRWK
jgi:hypothetical protein